MRKLALDQTLRFERFCGLKVASGQNELDQAVAAVIVRDQLMTQDFKCVGHGAACHRGLLLLGEVLARRCHALARPCASLALA